MWTIRGFTERVGKRVLEKTTLLLRFTLVSIPNSLGETNGETAPSTLYPSHKPRPSPWAETMASTTNSRMGPPWVAEPFHVTLIE